MKPDTLRTIEFPAVVVHIGARFVLSVFRSGEHVLCDIDRSQGPNYRRIAATCGYPGGALDHARYARHHDLTHHWLADRRGEGRSKTLYAVAKGQTYPGAEREEHRVNCLQRLWADEITRTPWRIQEIRAARASLGPEWERELDVLGVLLHSVP